MRADLPFNNVKIIMSSHLDIPWRLMPIVMKDMLFNDPKYDRTEYALLVRSQKDLDTLLAQLNAHTRPK